MQSMREQVRLHHKERDQHIGDSMGQLGQFLQVDSTRERKGRKDYSRLNI